MKTFITQVEKIVNTVNLRYVSGLITQCSYLNALEFRVKQALIFFYRVSVSDTRATLDALLVLRVLRVIKLIGSIRGFKVFIKTIMNLGPALVVYGGVLFVSVSLRQVS
jgi:hypothetical protein